ncbi:MAG: AAA family ATPase, partial [Gammaproteobacteria bacterium]|nr:AAA family ATPase [Gammaproteobacteria bacterium]
MIKIKSILIENFRGIKRLQIDLNCINLIIQGLNGTGKSGVVDAIEFGLTGEITRLSGVGTANISLKSHAPHVDFRDMPEKAKVVIDIINQQGEIFTIERTVASPQKPSINPNNNEAQRILSFLKEHPEFALSRKEILKFILAEPGKRAKEVQALLKMEAVEKVRTSFQTLCNKMQRELTAKSNEVNHSTKNFLNHLQLQELKQELVITSINKVRKSIGLDEILSISSQTKLSEGIDSKISDTKKQISKKDAQEKINAFVLKITQHQEIVKSALNETKLAINEIEKSPDILNNISKQHLYETGLDLVQEEICPLCDNEWDIEKLKEYIQNKIEKNNHAVSIKNKILNGCDILKANWKIISDEIIEIKRTAISLNMTQEAEDLGKLVILILSDIKLLDSPFLNVENILKFVDNPYLRIDDNIQHILGTVLEEVKKLPEVSKEEEAKQYLIIADERFKNYQEKKREKDIYSIRYNLSKNLSDIYTSISEEKLLHLYSEVEKEFSKFYGQINKEDESGFKANLTPNQGGLTFEVD